MIGFRDPKGGILTCKIYIHNIPIFIHVQGSCCKSNVSGETFSRG
jgi:hypothetical protein